MVRLPHFWDVVSSILGDCSLWGVAHSILGGHPLQLSWRGGVVLSILGGDVLSILGGGGGAGGRGRGRSQQSSENHIAARR